MGRPTLRSTGAKVNNFIRSKSRSIKDQIQADHQIKSNWFSLFHRSLLHFQLGVCDASKLEADSYKGLLSTQSLFLSTMGFSAPNRPPSPALRSNSATAVRSRSRLIVPFLKCLTLCFVSILVLVAVLGSGSSKHRLYSGYRRIQAGALQALVSHEAASSFDIGNPSLKNTKGCPDGMEDYVPCYDTAASIKAGFKGGQELDRHCNLHKEKQCVVRPPKGYRLPPKWPASNSNVWTDNIKVAHDHSSNRMLMEESTISFPSEESVMKEYVSELETMLAPKSNNKTFSEVGIRLVLDVGSEVAGFASYLLTKNLLTMSISAYDKRGGPVQLAQERGLPSMIASFSSVRLPYPFSAFDMIHCKSCGVQWHQKDGIFLLEANRLLRPGGYFIWTPSSLNQSSEEAMEKLTTSICWSQIARNGRTIIWQKTTKQRCYVSRKRSTLSMCEPEVSEFQSSLKTCITAAPKGRWRTVQQQHLWPNRLMLSARRLSRYGMDSKNFSEDVQSWLAKLTNYWSLFTPVIFSDHPKRPGDEDPAAPNNVVRNLMDMNAQYGGFNAALLTAGKPVWVMNVVPTTAPNTLTAVYDRGLLGVTHDWCEAFPTYPRTYDLLYATSLLSQELRRPKPCGLLPLILEIDRLLRPEGWVLLQDEQQVIETARSLLVQIRWEARIIEIPGQGDQRLLVGQKNWRK